MKNKIKLKISVAVLLILSIAAGAYYWNWWTVHNPPVIAQSYGSSIPAQESGTASTKPVDGKNDDNIFSTKGWTNILLLGTDNYGQGAARSDSIMLISANVDTHKVFIISIPRDTRVNIPGVGLTKITHANILGEIKGGIRAGTLESAKAVSGLLGVNINYYFKINLQGFAKVVDSMGGIDVNLPEAVNDKVQKIYLPAGINHLSGEEAVRLSRVRYGLSNGDFGRQENQAMLLSTLAQEMLKLSNVPKLPKTLGAISKDFMDTNMTTGEMIAIGLNFKGINKDSIRYYQLPGKGIKAYDKLVGANLYYYEPDMTGVEKVVRKAFGQ